MTPEELKQWRLTKGLNQATAAKMFGLGSYQTWQRWEYGTRDIPNWLPLAIKNQNILDMMEDIA